MSVHFPEVKATFIHVPKTGGTSFYQWIDSAGLVYDKQEINHFTVGSINGARQQWGDLGTVFSFVRNPYSRLVSMYHYHYEKARLYVNNPNLINKDDLAMSFTDYLRVLSVSSRGFDYWLECIYYGKKELYGKHATRDEVTISSWFNGEMPNIIIKTEELNQEFNKIYQLLTDGQCTIPLPWINTSNHKSYQEYYNSKSKQWVADQFKDDLELFDYTF